MKFRIILATLALLVSACTTPPPVTGTFANKDGLIRIHPTGRIELVVEPRSAK